MVLCSIKLFILYTEFETAKVYWQDVIQGGGACLTKGDLLAKGNMKNKYFRKNQSHTIYNSLILIDSEKNFS